MKLFRNIALITLAILCSCSQVETPVSGEPVALSYDVVLPDTKAVAADGSQINKVWFALYRPNGELATNYAPVEFSNGSARCQVVMMRGQSYKIVFVAQHYKDEVTPVYPIDSENAKIGLPTNPESNSDKYDLFYGVDEVVEYDGRPTGSIALDRIVAMVNFNCSDAYATSLAAEGVTQSSITISGAADGWDLLKGEVTSGKDNLSFSKADIPATNHLGTAFCFANERISATLNLYSAADALVRTISVSDAQVDTNKKTNVEIY